MIFTVSPNHLLDNVAPPSPDSLEITSENLLSDAAAYKAALPGRKCPTMATFFALTSLSFSK